MTRALTMLGLALLAACTTTTEVRLEFCATVETFPPDVPQVAADSVRVDDCDDPTLNGHVFRRTP